MASFHRILIYKLFIYNYIYHIIIINTNQRTYFEWCFIFIIDINSLSNEVSCIWCV